MSRSMVIALLLSGCATGFSGDGDSGTGGDARTDMLTRTDMGRMDGTVMDMAPVDMAPPCMEDSHPSACNMATDLGMFAAGDSMDVMGNLPTLRDEDWFKVAFPPESMPLMPGGGMPSIDIDGDTTTIIDIRTSCTAGPVVCGEGSTTNMTSYSFVDDQAMPGEMQWSTRDIAWPAEVWIKVGRSGGPANCDDYTLTVSR